MGLYSLLQADKMDGKDEVIVAGYTCVVVTNAIKYAGLQAIYIDVEEDNLNIDPELLRNAINTRTKAIIFTHNFGISCEYISEFKEAYPEIMIIEDAAHTFGSVTKEGVKAGLPGDASFFSLEYSKPLTTGMGGIVIVNDSTLSESLRSSYDTLPGYPFFTNLRILASLKIHVFSSSRCTASLKRWMAGFLYVTGLLYKSPPAELRGEMPAHYPVKLNPYLAHLLYLQIKNIEETNHKKDLLVKRYFETFKDIPGIRQYYSTDYNYVRYPVLFDSNIPAGKISNIKNALKKSGIEVGEWFNDVVHPKGSYRYCYVDGSCPVGESVSERMINFPVTIHRQLVDKDFKKIREILIHHLKRPSSRESQEK
jgi:dTDP-4-amino-4,6-dideoxygalactose transaminase